MGLSYEIKAVSLPREGHAQLQSCVQLEYMFVVLHFYKMKPFNVFYFTFRVRTHSNKPYLIQFP